MANLPGDLQVLPMAPEKKAFLLQRGVNKARNNQVWGSGVGGHVTGQWMGEECSPEVRPFQERLEKWTCSLSQ